MCVCVYVLYKKSVVFFAASVCLCVPVPVFFFFFVGFLQSASTLRASIFFLWFGDTTVSLIDFLIGLFII